MKAKKWLTIITLVIYAIIDFLELNKMVGYNKCWIA